MRMTTAEFLKRTSIVVLVALAPVLIWFLFDVILITVGAILTATLLRLVAEPFMRWCKIPETLSLILSGLIIAGVVGGTGYLFGTEISTELQDVLNRAETAQSTIMETLQNSGIGRLVLSHVQGGNFSIGTFLAGFFSLSIRFLEATVVTIIAGLYLAAQPKLYRAGLRKLFPREQQASADETIEDIGNALRLWLLGQLVQMFLIGLLSLLAVWLIGLPSPLALGVIAGIAEFIPYLGPILASVPAILVAANVGLDAIIWTIVAYIIIHQVEGDVIAPMIQRHMVFIPPAVMLLGIIAISFLFGAAAIIFAAPIVVVLFVFVKKVYVRDSLGEQTSIPGESG